MPVTTADTIISVAREIADGDELRTTQIAREKNLDIATIFRWIAKGLPASDGSRVRLAAVKRGKTWLTSRAALRRFFASLPTNNNDDSTRSRTSRADRSAASREAARTQAVDERRKRYGF